MALMTKFSDESERIKQKAEMPLSIRAGKDDSKSLESGYEKMMEKFDNEYRKVEEDFKKDCERIQFSEKRGSVPLLPNTYVIRGSVPKQRQKVKRALDMVGDETVMKDVNNIFIDPEQELPLVFYDERTIGLSEKFLTGSDGEVAKIILSSVHRRVHPEEAEGVEFAYAADVVEPKIKERMRKDSERKRQAEMEVYQVGVEQQPQMEIVSTENPVDKYEVKVVMPETENPIVEEKVPLGLGGNPDQFVKDVEQKAVGPSMFYNGGEITNG